MDIYLLDKVIRFIDYDSPIKENVETVDKMGLIKLVADNIKTDKFDESINICGGNTDHLFNYFVNQFKYVEAAGGIVKNSNNEFLFIIRWLMWDLPKGKIEKGETINEAAIREVCEETGLKDLTIVKDLNCTYHIYKSGSNWIIKKTYWFEMTTSQKGDLKPAIEEGISQAVWKDAKDAYSAINSSYISLKETFSEYFLKQIT